MTHVWLEYIAIFIFGSAIGSFLNVVIVRIPRNLSIIHPASHCPHCRRPIRPHENIPIISYLILGGRCAGCSIRIAPRYLIIEALTGAMAVLLLYWFNWTWDLLIYGVMTTVLIALSAIDVEVLRLPNPITLTGAILAVGLTLLLRSSFWLDMVLGGAVGAGVLILMGLLGGWLLKKNALGVGDVKLAGMLGLYLGVEKVLGMFIISVFLAAFGGGTLILTGLRKSNQLIPFGPYMSAGALVSLIWWESLWGWYRSLAGL